VREKRPGLLLLSLFIVCLCRRLNAPTASSWSRLKTKKKKKTDKNAGLRFPVARVSHRRVVGGAGSRRFDGDISSSRTGHSSEPTSRIRGAESSRQSTPQSNLARCLWWRCRLHCPGNLRSLLRWVRVILFLASFQISPYIFYSS